jgi:hypothetical protein
MKSRTRRALILASLGGGAAAAGAWYAWRRGTAEDRGKLFPAGRAEVHLVSVYQGDAGRAHVIVGKTAGRVLLMLFAFSPVEWTIVAESGHRLSRIVIIGLQEARFSLKGASGIETTIAGAEIMNAPGLDWVDGTFPHEPRGNGAIEAAEIVEVLTGKKPTTFQGGYTALGAYNVSSSTPPLVLPEARAVSALPPETVPLVMEAPYRAEGLYVRYREVGAYTSAWSSRRLIAGKAYFEAVLDVAGQGGAGRYTNIGIGAAQPGGALEENPRALVPMINEGEELLYRNGDVFGVAVDLDSGRACHRVNEKWITGEPGSGSGIKFRPGRQRLAYFQATNGAGWTVNFGATPFRGARPAGFSSWDGSQRA